MRRLLGDVARQLDIRLPGIVDEMTGLLADSVTELRPDPQLVEMLRASVEGNVSTICHILANDIALSNLQPTTAAVEYAQRLAQRDVPISALTRAYYLGQSMFLRLGIDAVESMAVREEERIELVRAVADVVHRYIDWILQYVSDVHEAERRRWNGGRGAVFASTVHRLLRGESNDAARFERETGFSVTSPFVALILWSDEDASFLAPIVRSLTQRLATRWRTGRAPLIVTEDPTTTWAWIPVAPSIAVSSEEIRNELGSEQLLRVAVADLATGVDGFRTSHRQALDARMVALTSQPHHAEAVVRYADPAVSLLAMFTRDLRTTRRWVQTVLGTLARTDENARILRDTYRAYYAAGANVTQTALELGIHRNTVRRRIASTPAALQQRDPLEISMALRLFDAFGPGS
ncbi:hypothetical protein RR49_01105 [Microbacterium ginsengisoli]|nr:hypothetical protein RR49_01105 [Microbacterium ginsengisoli]